MKNYKTRSSIFKLNDLLGGYLTKIEKNMDLNPSKIFEFWGTLLGEKFAALTVPVNFQNGVLKIKVKSTTLFSLFVQTESPRLLKEMQKQFPSAGIRKLLFFIG